MNNNLEELYSRYSTRELLKIIKQQEDYRPEAIAVVRQILSTRRAVSEEEEALNKEMFQDFLEQEQRKELLERKWPAFFMLQRLVTRPSLLREDKYLLLLLQVMLAIYYLLNLSVILKGFYYQLKFISTVSYFLMFLNMIHLVSPPIIIWLIWSNKSSGWIFSSLGKWITITNTILALSIFLINYPDSMIWELFQAFVIDYILLVGILVVLNLERTRNALKISASMQRLVIIGGIVLGIGYYYFISNAYL